ncbi:MAG: nucleotidyltransferase substrate binding protein [Akkermansiaceae bacterium]|jgi:nucleotidyltransferase substrate binding protein (TIGR01987 family)
MSSPDIRWIQRFDNFKRAFARLSAASALAEQRELSDLERQGLIQAFECTHELAWNTLKDFLTARGSAEKLYGSRDSTRAAFAAGLVENGEAWMEMIQHRNESSHTYNDDVAGKIMAAVQTHYVPAFQAFQRRFLELEKEESA